MTAFYTRVWIRDGAIFCLHADTRPIGSDIFTEWSDQIIDLEIDAPYEAADTLRDHLRYGPTGVTSSTRAIVTTAVRDGIPRDVEAELLQLRSQMKLSFAQLLIGLVGEGWITQAEGTAWLVNRTPPGPVTALIGQLPAEQQFPALARAVAPSEVLRLDPLVVGLGSYTGKTPEQIDNFFQTYSVV